MDIRRARNVAFNQRRVKGVEWQLNFIVMPILHALWRHRLHGHVTVTNEAEDTDRLLFFQQVCYSTLDDEREWADYKTTNTMRSRQEKKRTKQVRSNAIRVT